jgi:hypothetical protein
MFPLFPFKNQGTVKALRKFQASDLEGRFGNFINKNKTRNNQMPTSRTIKQIVMYSGNYIDSSNSKEPTNTRNNVETSQHPHLEQKKLHIKKRILA